MKEEKRKSRERRRRGEHTICFYGVLLFHVEFSFSHCLMNNMQTGDKPTDISVYPSLTPGLLLTLHSLSYALHLSSLIPHPSSLIPHPSSLLFFPPLLPSSCLIPHSPPLISHLSPSSLTFIPCVWTSDRRRGEGEAPQQLTNGVSPICTRYERGERERRQRGRGRWL